jgi:hypothetical protein
MIPTAKELNRKLDAALGQEEVRNIIMNASLGRRVSGSYYGTPFTGVTYEKGCYGAGRISVKLDHCVEHGGTLRSKLGFCGNGTCLQGMRFTE